jgi:hypothetical protein
LVPGPAVMRFVVRPWRVTRNDWVLEACVVCKANEERNRAIYFGGVQSEYLLSLSGNTSQNMLKARL